MGTIRHITAKLKIDTVNGGMLISGTAVAVNAQGTFTMHRLASAPPPPPPGPSYSLDISSPTNNATIAGTINLVGVAPGHLNVEVRMGGTVIGSATPDGSGNFTISIDTTLRSNGATTWQVDAWDSPAGQPFNHHAQVLLSLTISNAVPQNSPLNAGHLSTLIAAPASYVSIVDKGAVADGVTNNIVAIRNAISAAAIAAHKTAYVPAGDFAYSGVISVSGTVTLVGQGPTSILRGLDWTNRCIRMMGNTPVVKNLALFTNGVGTRQAPWEYTGIHIQGASNFSISNVYIKHNGAAGIQTSHSAGPGTIEQSTLSGTLADSIHLTDEAHDITVSLNKIRKSGDDGIACVSYGYDNGNVKNVTANYNWIEGNLGGRCMTVVGGGPNIRYHNNLMQNNLNWAGIYIAQEDSYATLAASNITADYNTVENCGNNAAGHAGIMIFSDGTHTNDSIKMLRNDIICTARNTNGIRYYGPLTNVILDSNKITGAGTAYVGGNHAGVTTTLYTNGNAGYAYTTPGVTDPAPGPAPGPMPSITTSRHPRDLLQVGNPALDTYWVEDNRWRDQSGGLSAGVTPSDFFPQRVNGIYYEAYWGFQAFKFDNVPTHFNVVYLFHCRFNADGSLYFDWGADFPSSRVQAVRNRGQKVILTVGGANFAFNFQNRTQSTNFVNSFQTFYTQFGGLDGCDFNNFEQLDFNSTFITEMVWIAGQLRALYGPGFAITCAPAATRTGGPPVNGIAMNNGRDLSLCGALADNNLLTYCAPQFYDWSFYKQENTISQVTQQWIDRLGASKVIIGTAAGYDPTNSPTLAEAEREWSKTYATNPNLRGVMGWNARDNNTAGNQFGPAFYNRFSAVSATATIREGANLDQFMQQVERSTTVGPNGEVACKFKWRWPTTVGGQTVDGNPAFPEVKSFPCIIYGQHPGYKGFYRYPGFENFERAVRLPDAAVVAAAPAGTPHKIAADWVTSGGSVSAVSPSGNPPGGDLPKQLLLNVNNLLTTGTYSASVSTGGKCHLTFDIWMQDPAKSTQTAGFANSPITHQIQIPLRNFGNFTEATRNSAWYDHDVTINNVTYHVYCSKNQLRDDTAGSVTSVAASGLRYNYGQLNPLHTSEETTKPRVGWKKIIFLHDGASHPLDANGSFSLEISKFLNHLNTRQDSRGTPFAQGTEQVVSMALGVEVAVGEGECTIWNYRTRVPV